MNELILFVWNILWITRRKKGKFKKIEGNITKTLPISSVFLNFKVRTLFLDASFLRIGTNWIHLLRRETYCQVLWKIYTNTFVALFVLFIKIEWLQITPGEHYFHRTNVQRILYVLIYVLHITYIYIIYFYYKYIKHEALERAMANGHRKKKKYCKSFTFSFKIPCSKLSRLNRISFPLKDRDFSVIYLNVFVVPPHYKCYYYQKRKTLYAMKCINEYFFWHMPYISC